MLSDRWPRPRLRGRSGTDTQQDPLIIRGVEVDRDTFNMNDLTPDSQSNTIDAYQHDIFVACMAERGFKDEPSSGEGDTPYNLAYETQATGYRGGDISSIEPSLVELPDGSSYSMTTTQTPDTCWWEAWSSLGHDPLYRFALAMRLNDLRNDAVSGAQNDTERSHLEYQVAADHQDLVTAYVEMRDAEYAAVPDSYKSQN